MKNFSHSIIRLFILTLLVGCGSAKVKKAPKRNEAYQQTILTKPQKNSSVGIASFYSDKFNGSKTASGEIFSNHSLTAAHRSLPFGTQVRVIGLWNNKSVIVRINDRGPFSTNRIIDISKSAAAKIGLINKGTGKVKIEVLR